MFTVRPASLLLVMEYLQARGFAFAIRNAIDNNGYQHLGSLACADLDPERVRIVAGRSVSVVEELDYLEHDVGQSVKVGDMLGYPSCCVLGRSGPESKMTDCRAANRVVRGMLASESFHSSVNIMLRDTAIPCAAPWALIPHYPCSFDCTGSLENAREWRLLCRRLWPGWLDAMEPWLSALTLIWNDAGWPSDYWDDTVGVALPGAVRAANNVAVASTPGVSLGFGRTPAGRLVRDPVAAQFRSEHTWIAGASGDSCIIPTADCGEPLVVEWVPVLFH